MRLSVALGCLVLLGCTGPYSTGALWAQQNLQQETALFRLSDAQRADRARYVELGLADETLAAERARIESGLLACPGPTGERQLLAPSVGDRSRDIVRIRVEGDTARSGSLAQVALADWRLRRALATGDASFCDQARQALAGEASGEPPGASTGEVTDLLTGPATAIVTRDQPHMVTPLETVSVNVALSSYGLGAVDTLRAEVPMPQYLAAVYGGDLVGTIAPTALNGETPEALVDRFAPAYPMWEPDALYAALSAR